MEAMSKKEESRHEKAARSGRPVNPKSLQWMEKPETRAKTVQCSGKTAAGFKHMGDSG